MIIPNDSVMVSSSALMLLHEVIIGGGVIVSALASVAIAFIQRGRQETREAVAIVGQNMIKLDEVHQKVEEVRQDVNSGATANRELLAEANAMIARLNRQMPTPPAPKRRHRKTDK